MLWSLKEKAKTTIIKLLRKADEDGVKKDKERDKEKNKDKEKYKDKTKVSKTNMLSLYIMTLSYNQGLHVTCAYS